MSGILSAIMATALPSGGGGGGGPSIASRLSIGLFTGDGAATRSLSGIDGTAGAVSILKARNNSQASALYYSATGAGVLRGTLASTGVPVASGTFTASGLDLTDATDNVSARTYAHWSLKKAAGFLDVVTYTGTGAAHTIAHSLGVAPALMIIRRTDVISNWYLHQVDAGAGSSTVMNGAAAFAADTTFLNNTAPTASVFTVGTSSFSNTSGGSYVAILMAHDTGSSGLVRGFTYTGNATALGPAVSLGWQPQMVLLLGANTRHVFDTTRTPGFTGNDAVVSLGAASAETGATDLIQLTADGFQAVGSASLTNTDTRLYYGVAFRAP